jgi:transposase
MAKIKPMPGRKRRQPFSAFPYRYRNLVERFFSKLKHFRAVATGFEKHSENYLALVRLAFSQNLVAALRVGELEIPIGRSESVQAGARP